MNQIESNFSYEKLLAAVPLFAGLFAIVFDTGYFLAVGASYYTLFSITEHIGFATQVLPAAMLIAVLTAAAIIFAIKLGPVIRINVHQFVGILLLAGFFLGMVGSDVTRSHDYTSLILLLLFFVPFGGIVWALRNNINANLLTILGITCGLFLDLEIGVLSGHATLSSKRDIQIMMLQKGEKIKGRIIRAGDKGVLFWTIPSKKIYFYKWINIESIESSDPIQEMNFD